MSEFFLSCVIKKFSIRMRVNLYACVQFLFCLYPNLCYMAYQSVLSACYFCFDFFPDHVPGLWFDRRDQKLVATKNRLWFDRARPRQICSTVLDQSKICFDCDRPKKCARRARPKHKMFRLNSCMF